MEHLKDEVTRIRETGEALLAAHESLRQALDDQAAINDRVRQLTQELETAKANYNEAIGSYSPVPR